jgi:hypothetical protein
METSPEGLIEGHPYARILIETQDLLDKMKNHRELTEQMKHLESTPI